MTCKTQFQCEYLIRSSAQVLFNMISTPGGLSRWFADDVNIKNKVYSFFWDGNEEKARLISKKMKESIRFQWEEDADSNYFFEFKLKTDPLTREVALIITDFSEEDEQESALRLWDAQINKLKQVLGC